MVWVVPRAGQRPSPSTPPTRDLLLPKPPGETVTRVSELEATTVFVRFNDRVLRCLPPKPHEQGLDCRTADVEAGVVTATRRPAAE